MIEYAYSIADKITEDFLVSEKCPINQLYTFNEQYEYEEENDPADDNYSQQIAAPDNNSGSWMLISDIIMMSSMMGNRKYSLYNAFSFCL